MSGWFAHERSGTGIAFGALTGLALGTAVGFGTLHPFAHSSGYGMGMVLGGNLKDSSRWGDRRATSTRKPSEHMSFRHATVLSGHLETCPNPSFQRYLIVESCPGRTRSLAFALGAYA
jgi:hypothetical protein